jgi:hypothetical protein
MLLLTLGYLRRTEGANGHGVRLSASGRQGERGWNHTPLTPYFAMSLR